jgi:nicotinamide mononucleotide transporter
MYNWLSDNFIEIFGAVTGIIYVFFEIRQTIWLWPLGIATSAAYVWIFFSSKLYADMSLQTYYVVISVLGWYWWIKGAGSRRDGETKGLRDEETGGRGDLESGGNLKVSRIKTRLAFVLLVIFFILWLVMYFVLSRLTDSPVPGWDGFITSLSVIGTWMLARKILEHWYLWIIVNFVSVILYFTRGLYPTVILYFVYLTMSFIGLATWKKSLHINK